MDRCPWRSADHRIRDQQPAGTHIRNHVHSHSRDLTSASVFTATA